MSQPDENKQGRYFHRTMTVGHIRKPDASGNIQVVFLESARFHRLLRSNSKFNDLLKHLQDAKKGGHAVNVMTSSMESDIIEDVT
jgi:hypothetical protein